MKQDSIITPAGMSALLSGDVDNFIAASTPGGIEAQEAQGQRDFVNRATLPKEIRGGSRSDLEKAGVKFKEDSDDLFVNVILPDGWKKQPTDHSMHNEIIDGNGRKRASIFYKAAFYDRRADMSMNTRFSVQVLPEDQYKDSTLSYEDRRDGKWYGMVLDGDKVIFRTDPQKKPSYGDEDALLATAKQWLYKRYPDWESVSAYWDEPKMS